MKIVVLFAAACTVACSGSASNTQRPSGAAGVPDAQAGTSSAAAGSAPTAGAFDQPRAGVGGGVAGATVLPQAGDQSAPEPSTIEPIAIDECDASNPAGLGDAERMALRQGGSGAGPRLLYPYEGTVFPRGMLAPLWMWEGGGDYVYVHIKSTSFEYWGCLRPTAPGQLQLPQHVWDEAGARTHGKNDPYTVELSVMTGGEVAGPSSQQLVIAQATIQGSIFYNSYSSLLGGLGGNVLRIPQGGQAEAFISNECNGCHSLSADGSRLLSQTLVTGGRAYPMSPGMPPNPAAMPAPSRVAYGALYPDGTKYVSTSVAVEVARAALTGGGLPAEATLYETDTGSVLPSQGIPPGALMPMFSPDGSMLVFTDHAVNNGSALALVDFATATNQAGNYRVVYEDNEMRPGWPFMLPDNGAIVFARTDGADFSGDGAGLLGLPLLGPYGELHMVDVDTGTATLMARAMGYATEADAAAGNTYLPFGPGEVGKNYFPTVSPVAAGGFFWVFFDAVRNYGNLGLQRQLWGTAVDISPSGDYTTDRSRPAFYLPGQEFGTGNHRAFAALDPCKQDGDTCASGIDCCGGFCFIPDDRNTEFGEQPLGTCSSDVPTCAKRNERCTSSSDCCPPESEGEPQNTCIAGFCAFIAVD